MARRQIGARNLGTSRPREQRRSQPGPVKLLDWEGINRSLSPVYAAAKGEQAWPPLAMFKVLLLSVGYDLSDVKLVEALDDRLLPALLRFLRIEPTPERTAFVRFRKELICCGLDQALFDTVTGQLRANVEDLALPVVVHGDGL